MPRKTWADFSDFINKLNLFSIGASVFLVSEAAYHHWFRVWRTYFRGESTVEIWPTKGMDFVDMFNYLQLYLRGKESKEHASHPFCFPLGWLQFTPLAIFPANTAYTLWTIITLFALIGIFYLALKNAPEKFEKGVVWVVSLAGAYVFYNTYPMLFEIERGNTNTVAALFMLLALLGLTKGHYKTAIVGLIFAIHPKFSPVILIAPFLLRAGWKWTAGLLVANFAAIFIGGFKGWTIFLNRIESAMAKSKPLWRGCHSLESWTHDLTLRGYVSAEGGEKLYWSIFFSICALFGLAWVRYAWKSGLLKTCFKKPALGAFDLAEIGMIGMAFQMMSLIPVVSQDYKMVIHLVPFLLLITQKREPAFRNGSWGLALVLILSVSMGYLFGPSAFVKTPAILVNFACYSIFAFAGKVTARA